MSSSWTRESWIKSILNPTIKSCSSTKNRPTSLVKSKARMISLSPSPKCSHTLRKKLGKYQKSLIKFWTPLTYKTTSIWICSTGLIKTKSLWLLIRPSICGPAAPLKSQGFTKQAKLMTTYALFPFVTKIK